MPARGRVPGGKAPTAERCGHFPALHRIRRCPLPRVSSETLGHVLSPEEDGFPSAGCLDGVWAGERMPEGERGEAPGDPFHQVLIAVRALCGPGLTAHPEDISGLATETASCGKEGRT
ncbi:unnamed protein product [Rangifer tarandus platyrhynchus]|uniref:Uncharacterized protein n=1 Tax=Rangifer tarandus platyrhynchus TaxID=3082113 RepID=A0ACB1KHB8_RANTA